MRIGKKDWEMKAFFAAGCLALILVSCGSREPLVVRQFTLRETDPDWSDDRLIRGEIQKRLYGAVEQSEREKRIGQYYTARWRVDPAAGPIEVGFYYRQASTGSKVQKLTQKVQPNKETGVVEFSVTGDSYLKGGRVLAWRMELRRSGQLLGEKKSFLWE